MKLESLELDSFGSLVRDVLLSVSACLVVYWELREDFLVLVELWWLLDRDCWLEEELSVFILFLLFLLPLGLLLCILCRWRVQVKAQYLG